MADSRENLKVLYECFKEVDAKQWAKATPEELAIALFGDQDQGAGLSIRILAKLAHKCDTFDKYFEMVSGNDIPPVKLTSDEMKLLKGGGGASLFTRLGTHIAKSGKLTTYFQEISGSVYRASGAITKLTPEVSAGMKDVTRQWSAAQKMLESGRVKQAFAQAVREATGYLRIMN